MPTPPATPDHIPPPPRPVARVAKRRRLPGQPFTVPGMGAFQEACLAGILALALSWGSVELWFLLGGPLADSQAAVVLAAFQR